MTTTMAMADNALQRRVLSDKSVVTYRLLSRLLNCPANEAKEHLELFHTKFPDETHAIYVVNGLYRLPEVKRQTKASNVEEIPMPVGDEMSDAVSQECTRAVPRTTYEIVQEEELASSKARFESIESVFIYSIQPKRLVDIALAIAANKSIAFDAKCMRNTASSDNGARFGVIQLPLRKVDIVPKGAVRPQTPTPQRNAPNLSTFSSKIKEAPTSAIKANKGATSGGQPKDNAAVISNDTQSEAVIQSDDLDLVAWAGNDAAMEEMMRLERNALPLETEFSESNVAPLAGAKPRVRKKRLIKKTIRDTKGNRRTEEVEESYSEDEDTDQKPDDTQIPASTNVIVNAAAASSIRKTPSASYTTSATKKKPNTDDQGQTSLSSFFKKPTAMKKG